MDFWRLYRLVFAKRWLIAAMMLLAGAVIFLGTFWQAQQKRFLAEAIMQPQEMAGLPPPATSSEATPPTNIPERAATISDLIMILRSSNDLYLQTADLLRKNQSERASEVQRVLEKNGYFAPFDADIERQAEQLVRRGELRESETKTFGSEGRRKVREKTVTLLTQGTDDRGEFGVSGLRETSSEIAEIIRKNMTFETVSGPLNTENNPQIVNQIRVTGRFEREAEADLYVNLLCVAFIDFYTNKSAGALNTRIAAYQSNLAAANARLQKAKAAEVAYRKANGVTLTTAQDSAITQEIAYQNQRNQLEQELQGANAAVATLEGAVTQAKTSKTTALPASENEDVRRLQFRVAEAKIAFDKVKASNNGEASDIYLIAEAELKSAQVELDAARKRPYTTTTLNPNADAFQSQLNTARVRRDDATQRLAALDKQLAVQKAQVANLPAAQAKLGDLRREENLAEASVREYETALSRAKNYAIERSRAGTISIVSQAHTTPLGEEAVSQRVKLIAYGMALALVFGVALVVGSDALDNSIQSREDLEKLLGLPVAGIIPAFPSDPAHAPRIALMEPLSPASEAYRLLRTDLLFTAADQPFQSLMVVTGKPGQGATTTLSNLAITLAQAGKRVILVDTDLRLPKLHRVFGRENEIGLTSLLYDQVKVSEAVLPTPVENLSLLSAGPVTMNPSELLGSPRMQLIHEILKQQADFVLFDTPSAIAFSDAAILSSFLDATLMVVRSSNVPRGAEEQVLTLLHKARANVIGVVLNGVPAERVDSVHYHHSYYPAFPSGNGGQSIGLPHPTPLSLPNGAPGDPKSAETTGSTLSETETAAAPAPPFTRNYHNGTLVDKPKKSPFPSGDLTGKMLLLVLLAGAATGGLVLLLGSGVSVK